MDALRQYGITGPFVLAFGFIARYKGIDRLLEAAEKLPDPSRVAIVGGRSLSLSGNVQYEAYYTALRQWAAKLGVPWISYLPEEQIAPAFGAAAALVLPYVRFHAASGPLALAAACDTPVILSTELGVAEFEGVDCEPTPSHLAACIERVFVDETYRERLRRAVRTFARNASAEVVTRSYLSMFGMTGT
jgi:glycosyltransferase involved in cell wall biosynthesis